MKESLRLLLDQHAGDPLKQYPLARITVDGVKDFVLGEMRIAAAETDWKAEYTLFGMACAIEDDTRKADVLNHLLVMPGHHRHQEVTMEIQRLRSPSSVPYIRRMLEGGFDSLAYTGSEHRTIAKWFSHALAKIGTPESIALIRVRGLWRRKHRPRDAVPP